jgi:hypothetical protein
VNWRASVRAMVSKLLAVGCWLAPGPTCQRLLGAALLVSLTVGLLGVIAFALVGR